MSMEINNNNIVGKAAPAQESASSEKFEVKEVRVGSIFIKDDGDGKISLNDFSRTTDKLTEFIKQYTNGTAEWTKESYNAVVNYLNKNKDEIKNDSIKETIDSFKAKANDKSQIVSSQVDGDWTVTTFKDGTSMRENKSENKVRYYDAQGRWVAGTTKQGTDYINTYVEEDSDCSYAYVSEETGTNTIYYYSKNDKLLFTDDGKEKIIYIDGPDGKLQQVEQRDSKTGKLLLIGFADENEKVVKTKEFKKDPVSNKPYIEETDYNTNKSMKIYDAVVLSDIFEVKDPETGEVTYRKVIDHKNNTMTVTENGVTTTTNLLTGEVVKTPAA